MTLFVQLMLLFLIVCAVAVCVTRDLLTSVVIYMGYSLVMSIVWITLESPDLAITEAAVGAGVTSLLLFLTLKKIHAIQAVSGQCPPPPPKDLAESETIADVAGAVEAAEAVSGGQCPPPPPKSLVHDEVMAPEAESSEISEAEATEAAEAEEVEEIEEAEEASGREAAEGSECDPAEGGGAHA